MRVWRVRVERESGIRKKQKKANVKILSGLGSSLVAGGERDLKP